jgi:glycosyltransferase involved in cell wall biosynthesis
MTSPEISVLMPVYNGEKFVEAAMRSALSQEGEFDIVVHDDGSSDGTLDILKRLATSDPRLSISSAANAGPAAARNICLSRARGRFIAFLDHDDLWPEGRLARQAAMLVHDEEVGTVLGHSWLFERLDERGLPARTPRSRRVLTGLLQAGLFRREALEEAGSFDPGLKAADDFDLLLRLLEGRWHLAIDPEVAVYYRLHEGQWTADTGFSASQTVLALHRSLKRRRRDGETMPLRRPVR